MQTTGLPSTKEQRKIEALLAKLAQMKLAIAAKAARTA
jgi:hypothetical protein